MAIAPVLSRSEVNGGEAMQFYPHALMPDAYILKSPKDSKYYYGSGKDAQVRLKAHNAGKVRSTKARKPFVLIHAEHCETKIEASRRERFFKSIEGYIWLKEKGII